MKNKIYLIIIGILIITLTTLLILTFNVRNQQSSNHTNNVNNNTINNDDNGDDPQGFIVEPEPDNENTNWVPDEPDAEIKDNISERHVKDKVSVFMDLFHYNEEKNLGIIEFSIVNDSNHKKEVIISFPKSSCDNNSFSFIVDTKASIGTFKTEVQTDCKNLFEQQDYIVNSGDINE